MANSLIQLKELGQSVWYDNLSRDLLLSGDLQRLIEEDGVSGVTSNPSIFEQAINGSKVYDNDLHHLVDEGMDVYGIYEGLALDDIRAAADLLFPVFERTSGGDGYVSLEVSPELAYDTGRTVEEAARLFNELGRPNVMIKVPATPEGFPAVKELIAAGVNVNITLIFSLEQYRKAAHAYMEGLEGWIATGGDPSKPASVASFFVSRVDTMVDQRLNEIADRTLRPEAQRLLGKAAIANARMAYAEFKKLFHGEPFAALKEKGCRVQRALWASTSTKDPNYLDTYYCDALAGPETVNTMPAATLDAYRDHGRPEVRIEENADEANEIFARLDELGINMDLVMEQLLENGVRSFADSFQKLLDGIAQKRTRLLRGWGHRSASLGTLQQKVDGRLRWCDKEMMSQKLWDGDTSLWTDDADQRAEIGQRLGWLHSVDIMMGETARIKMFAEDIRIEGFTRIVLLGMGGSSLASEVFGACCGAEEGYPALDVLDTTVPKSILEVERSLDLTKTLFIVSSKSGSTIEALSLFKYFFARVEEAVGENAGKHFVAITDPGTSLGKLASEKDFRKTFLNPPDIGGRFSALSYFGLVPAALIGMDVDRLLMRAAQAVESAEPGVPSLENPGLWLGVLMAEASLSNNDKLSLITSPGVKSFGLWLEQLIAESTGKEGKGIIPIHDEPFGPPDTYADDRLFVYLRLDDDGTHDAAVSALEAAGFPVVTLRLHTPYDLGREMFRWEFATAVAAVVLNINAFDQPNVQESKDITKELLGRYQETGAIPEGVMSRVDDENLESTLKEFLGTVNPGDYIAFNAFIHPSAEAEEALQKARDALRAKYRVATTLGFGPRYLHSTGQIHKGGPDEGVFIQLTVDDPEDIDVPGEGYSFGALKTCQAEGDYQALEKRGRRIMRIHLTSETDVEKLADLIRGI